MIITLANTEFNDINTLQTFYLGFIATLIKYYPQETLLPFLENAHCSGVIHPRMP